MNNKLTVDLQNVIDSTQVPSVDDIQTWVAAAIKSSEKKFEYPELSIRVVSAEESQQLNSEYRGKNKPTNVLSFPFEKPEMIPVEEIGELLGDLVICEQIVEEEAKQQGKTLQSHWAHMIIHGVLHLLGFDHIDDTEAQIMEAKETSIMANCGFTNPYQSVE